MCKKCSGRFLSLFSLVLLLLMSSVVPSFADTGTSTVALADDSQIRIQLLSDTSYIITENEETLLVKVKEDKNETVTILKDLETGSEDYFLRDEVKGTIYSSITGKTVNLGYSMNDKEINSLRSGGDLFIDNHEVSYEVIVYLVGSAGKIATMASAALAYKNVPGSAGVTLIIAILSGIGYMTAGAFDLAYPNGGIKFEEWEVERSSVRGGVTYYYYVTKIKNVKHVSVL